MTRLAKAGRRPMTSEKLLPCPFCGGDVQPRDALWPSEGDTDAVIHAQTTDCPLVQFSNYTADGSVYAEWNKRAKAEPTWDDAVKALEVRSEHMVTVVTNWASQAAKWLKEHNAPKQDKSR